MHHPARPQMKKFFLIVVIVFIEVVCAEIAKLCREKTHAQLDKSHTFAYNVKHGAIRGLLFIVVSVLADMKV